MDVSSLFLTKWRSVLVVQLLLVLFCPGVLVYGTSANIHPAPDKAVETGVPAFAVLGPEAIGLSAPPSDLYLLPDGRILAVAATEIALGDGVRWDVFRSVDAETTIAKKIAVDQAGRIYTGVEGRMMRIELGEDARWKFVPAAVLPKAGTSLSKVILTMVDISPEHWLWYADSGAIFEWQPGQEVRAIANFPSVERIFAVGKEYFASDQSSGKLFRLDLANLQKEQIPMGSAHTDGTVTAAVAFAPGQVLLGTNQVGLKIFDGATFQTFPSLGILNRNQRINDLCAINNDRFAAAVDAVGIVIFNREGRPVQVVDRSLDHRLGRVQRLRYAPNGVLWALLNEGIARIDLSTRVSDFSPLIPNSVTYTHVLRYADQLWLQTNNRVFRGIYDEAGRLEKFEDDFPAGRSAWNVCTAEGLLFCPTDQGVYVREGNAWKLAIPESVNAMLGAARPTDAGSLFLARGEIGFLKKAPDGTLNLRRFSTPELGDSFGAVQDDAGILWIELGTSRVGRIDMQSDRPVLEILTRSDGLTDGWVEIYLLGGLARFHVSGHLLRFDNATRRFIDDEALVRLHPPLLSASGRPLQDLSGRVWYSSNLAINSSEKHSSDGYRAVRQFPVGYDVSDIFSEDNGVLWLAGRRILLRLDTRISIPPPPPLQALITTVQFTTSNRHLFRPTEQLAPIDYSDNSLVIRFGAPANPFGSPVTFEVQLDGTGNDWVSTGTVGSAAFNRLKEGVHHFQVRPISAGVPGAAVQLAFTVRPPWFRSPLAWFSYVMTLIGLIVLATYIQRRDKARLKRLVAERTVELTMSEDRYRTLNIELESRVVERTAQLSSSNSELQQRELLFRLIFEHAPVGISWKRTDLGSQHHFNPTFCRILALPPELQPDQAQLLAMLHPEDAMRQVALSRQIESGQGNNYTVEQRYLRPDGSTVWGCFSVAVIRDPQGAIIQDIGILEDITARKKAEAELAATYKNLVEVSRTAGMAEVATGVLHNVGNVLNSLNVSATLVASGLRQSKTEAFAKVVAMLREHQSDLAAFLTTDAKGKRVPEYLESLARHFVEERARLLGETEALQVNVEHIKEIVSMQQNYATMVSTAESLDPVGLMENALQMNTSALSRHQVRIVREFHPVAPIFAEKGKVIQILVNLIGNAKYACTEGGATDKVMTLVIEPAGANRVRLIVRDNGVGIAPENITRIFGHGFTTKPTGHGFGLHSSANAATEMKGSLRAVSDGVGHGATFILELPAAPAVPGVVMVESMVGANA